MTDCNCGRCSICERLDKDAEIASLREKLAAAEASAQEWKGASILNASALKRAAEERNAAEALVAELVAVARAAETTQFFRHRHEEIMAQDALDAALAGLSLAALTALEETP